MLRLGKYLLVDRINHGGMADIFLAKTFGYEGADRLIAVKCIRSDIASDANFVSMFIDEAKLAVQLDHVNIARTYDLGRIRDTYFIAMEHVLGRDLRATLDRVNAVGDRMAYGIVLSVMDQMLEALDYAHRKADLTGVPLRIVHRDVSPHNVLISYSGEVKLIDFGIAKATTQGTPSTTGVLRGKYGYMSPEQVRGEPVDLRSDIFSTGALLFELLTGQRLFSGSSDYSILDKVRHCEIYPPSVIMTEVTRDLERVVLRALDPNPANRFPSASDMRDAIVEVMLRRYGYRSQRDISHFMSELFPQEMEHDRAAIERAEAVLKMPDRAEEYSGSPEQQIALGGTDTLPERRRLEEMSVTETEERPVQPVPTVDEPRALDVASDNPVFGGPPPPAALVSSAHRPSNETEVAVTGGETEVDYHPAPELRDDVAALPAQRMEESRSTTAVIRREPRPSTATQDTYVTRNRTPPEEENLALVTLPDVPVQKGGREDSVTEEILSQPTHVLPGSRKSKKRAWRDVAILGGAILVAAGLVAFTWFYTQRPDDEAMGSITVTSEPPGAEVLIDGASIGRTPIKSEKLRVGERVLVLEKDGYPPATQRVFISPNELLDVDVPLRQMPAN
ncbi:MAG: serine/threonine-protein kinase [Myxococcota bacterium]